MSVGVKRWLNGKSTDCPRLCNSNKPTWETKVGGRKVQVSRRVQSEFKVKLSKVRSSVVLSQKKKIKYLDI